ncbi:MAG: hypothetical protein IJQ68_04850 [Methanobrevibacter sp.]|uniref:hypothetical protein n=1 Tax=Methanobrevibacter sp. TaxID=66852 RepID=UPI0025D080FC|nr:hypothetical protein [Methanobrevibacter sp.]MBR0271307.1 hypothetical protein [Methanobrevibacter sp.]
MKTEKIIVDVVLFILMIIEFSRQYLDPTIHEIIGICLVILVIVHLYLNRSYLKGINKGKYTPKRSLTLAINIAFIVVFILNCAFGLISGQFIDMGNLTTIYLHKILAYLSVILLGMHLGTNLDKSIKKIKYKKIILPIIIVFGICCMIQIDFWNHLIGNYGFSMMTGNILINSVYYTGIVLMIIALFNLKS